MNNLTNLALYTMGVFLFCLLVLPKTTLALDDFDLYRYGDDEKVKIGRKNFIVKFIIYDSEDELNDAYYLDEERTEGEGVKAFSLSTEEEDVCYVHIKPAKKWDDRESMAIMGHEVYHCALARHRVATYDGEVETDDGVLQGLRTRQKSFSKQPANKPCKKKSREELLAEDRLLELEWLREDYEKMGIVIDE
ncbi:MAG: hypothetical protein HOK52_10130 [Candidatus Marinimicrobia bacterium]|nr:hypothetical protein [Candidatus Neomarinimicrobiota bacterium]